MYSKSRIGEVFVRKGMMTNEQVDTVLSIQLNHNKFFGELSVELGIISTDNLLDVLSEIYLIEEINLNNVVADPKAMALLSYNEAVDYDCVVFEQTNDTIKIALADPGQLDILDKLRKKFYLKNVKFYLSSKEQISIFLSIMSRSKLNELDPINLLNSILFFALENNASDLHFEPCNKKIVVRMRIDGILEKIQDIEISCWNTLQSRIKIIADLNITESRKPQSGHAHLRLCSNEIDLRISTHPGIFGENIAIRILNVTHGAKCLDQLNFQQKDLKFLKNMIKNSSGIFLIVGPTGSGKTTTLYAILQELEKDKLNIMTLEDPIEYQINGIKQLDLNDENLLSFSDGIKSILRQDPDVLLVGEIRDEKTAAAVLRAALTGRLVLATLHASTPIEALKRLEDLNVNIREFSNQILGIFTQRLIRKLDKLNTKTYKGRVPVCAWVQFSDIIKNHIYNKDYNKIILNKTFDESINYLVENKITDKNEITRVMGNNVNF